MFLHFTQQKRLQNRNDTEGKKTTATSAGCCDLGTSVSWSQKKWRTPSEIPPLAGQLMTHTYIAVRRPCVAATRPHRPLKSMRVILKWYIMKDHSFLILEM